MYFKVILMKLEQNFQTISAFTQMAQRQSYAVAAAAVTPTYSMSKAYNKSNSIFSAELRALILALEYIKTTNRRNYITSIISDSKSTLQALQDLQTNNPLVCRALELHTTLCNEHKKNHVLLAP